MVFSFCLALPVCVRGMEKPNEKYKKSELWREFDLLIVKWKDKLI